MPLSGAYFYPGLNGPFNTPIAAPMSSGSSASFLGEAYTTVFGPLNVSRWSTYRVSIINNSTNNLKSGSIEISPNNSNWEVLHSATFSPLTSSGFASYQASGQSNNWLRVRAWSSGSAGAITGSLQVMLTAIA